MESSNNSQVSHLSEESQKPSNHLLLNLIKDNTPSTEMSSNANINLQEESENQKITKTIQERRSAPPEVRKKIQKIQREGSFKEVVEVYENMGATGFPSLRQNKVLKRDFWILKARNNDNLREKLLMTAARNIPEIAHIHLNHLGDQATNHCNPLRFCDICRCCSQLLTPQTIELEIFPQRIDLLCESGNNEQTDEVTACLEDENTEPNLIRWRAQNAFEESKYYAGCDFDADDNSSSYEQSPSHFIQQAGEEEFSLRTLNLNLCATCIEAQEHEFQGSSSNLRRRGQNDQNSQKTFNCSFTEAIAD